MSETITTNSTALWTISHIL